MLICYYILAIRTMGETLWSSLSHPLTVTCSRGNSCWKNTSTFLTDGGYNNYIGVHSANRANGVAGIVNGSQEFIVDLGQPIQFSLLFINNDCMHDNIR